MLHHEIIKPGTLDLIKGIMAIPLPDNFRLVGGTALALQIGHRLSYDIDFFSDTSFSSNDILELIGQHYTIQIVRQNKGSAIITIEGIKTDLVSIQGSWLKPPVISEGIIMAGLEDIATMKLLAITNRGRKRDFFDLYFLLKQFTFRQLIELFQQKFKRHELFMLTQSLVYFEDAENDDEPNLLNEKVSWKQIKEKIIAEVKAFHG
jgi:predicted nucleotidyltransferase component of viral defense system